MTTPVTSAAAQAFLAAVDAELTDLPAEERAELLEDLEQHLLAVEADGDERSLTTRLGTAADYAAELRAAAGLPAREPVAPRRRLPDVRRKLAALTNHRFVRAVRTFVPQLAPAWWLLRGYLVVLLPCLWRISGSRDFPIPAPAGSKTLGLAAVLAAMALSVLTGKRRFPRPITMLVLALDLALAVTAVGVLRDAPHRLATHRTVVYNECLNCFRFSPLLSQQSGPVTDIYPYAADGTPLSGVLLYDQNGHPLQTGKQLWWADHCRRVLAPPLALDGAPVPFVYPQQYVLDRAGVQLNGLPVAAGQCKAIPRVAITPPALIKAAAPAKPTGAKPAPHAAAPARTPMPVR